MLSHFYEGQGARVFAGAVVIATALIIHPALLAQNAIHGNPGGNFVQVNAEIEILEWKVGLGTEDAPRPESFQIHAVVGKDKWAIGELFSGQTNYYSFDGARIAEWGYSFGTNNSIGSRYSRSFESSDGNPSKINASDRMDMVSRIAWLAFCAPATLNNPNRKLYPPWEFWKEYSDPSKFTEKVDRFNDELGLPKSVLIISHAEQPVVDYRVSGTTNIAGCLVPQSFYLLEYSPIGAKGWTVVLLAHGRISSVAPADGVPLISESTAEAFHEREAKRHAEIRGSLLR